MRNSARFTYEPRGRCYAFRQPLLQPWVRRELVEQGTDFVAEHFRGEPCLPPEFMGELRSDAPVRAG